MAPPFDHNPSSTLELEEGPGGDERSPGGALPVAGAAVAVASSKEPRHPKRSSYANHRKRPWPTTSTPQSTTPGVTFPPLPFLSFTCGECSSSSTATAADSSSSQAPLPLPPWMVCQVISGDDAVGRSSVVTASRTATWAASSASSDCESTRPLSEPPPPSSCGVPPEEEAATIKTVLRVQGVCCATEVPAVRRLLRRLPHVQSLQVLLATKTVAVRHTGSAASLAQALSDGGFPAEILLSQPLSSPPPSDPETKVAASDESPAVSDCYVESTFQIQDPTLLAGLPWVPPPQSPPAIRAWYVSAASRTVKVEHIDTAPISQVVDWLCEALLPGDCSRDDVVVLTDGGAERAYLPRNVDDGGPAQAADSSALPHVRQLSALATAVNERLPLPAQVLLSGLFWIVSMTASVLEWHSLEVAGLVSVAFGLPPVAAKAYRAAVLQRRLDANVLMVLAAIGAVLLQEWEEAASVAFLFSLSEHLEERATARARTALQHLLHLQPPHGRVLVSDGEVQLVPAHAIAVGSLLQVRTGDAVVTDGIVVHGKSVVDESSLTGESRPVARGVGDAVLGGSLNVGSTPLVVRTTRLSHESAVGRLVSIVEHAQASTSGWTLTLIDGFARTYTPVVLVAAGLMATLSWLGGIEVGRYWTYNALILIVVACPCALTIATPVTYAAGLAATAQRGVIVKGGGAVLETLGSVSKIMFDKTGTLTQGKFQVAYLQEVSGTNRADMISLLAALEAPSSHPLAVALLEATAKEVGFTQSQASVEDHQLVHGEGVQAVVDGQLAYAGNHRMMERLGFWETLDANYQRLVQEWTRTMGGGSSCSIGFVALQDRGILGLYCLSDQVRPEAKQVVKSLLADGYELALLTGDGHHAARAIASQVGLPESAVFSHLLPEDKLHLVGSSLERSTKQQRLLASRKVMFVGDGVNDAPALATADIGVAMGDGAAVSMEMSDVTLMDSNLAKLQLVLQVGRRVKRTVQENIALSLLCKFAVVSLTFFGYMTLLYAIASDVGVMLLVTLNGMKLLPGMTQDDMITRPCTDNRRRRRRIGSSNYTGVAGSPTLSEPTCIAEIV